MLGRKSPLATSESLSQEWLQVRLHGLTTQVEGPKKHAHPPPMWARGKEGTPYQI